MASSKYKMLQDIDEAISVIKEAGTWLQETGKNPSKWWKPENLTKEFLLRYASPDEFYVVTAGDKPAAAAILQTAQSNQGWDKVEDASPKSALYIHWLCVARAFAGFGLPAVLIDLAEKLASELNIEWLRVDTNADETKLRAMYEKLGFTLVTELDEGYRKTAFYQKPVI